MGDMVDIAALKGELSKRFHSDCRRCDAGAFFDSFSEFVRQVFNGTFSVDDNPYRKWMECRIKCFGKYAGMVADEIDDRILRDMHLCEDLRDNGLQTSIVVTCHEDGVEINGYHRLVIWQVLGNDKIRYIVK